MVLEANKEQCTFRESAESQRRTIKQAVNSFCHNNEMLNGRTMILLLRHSAIIFYCVIQCVWQFNQALSGFVVGHHGNISYEVKQFYLQSFSYRFIICIWLWLFVCLFFTSMLEGGDTQTGYRALQVVIIILYIFIHCQLEKVFDYTRASHRTRLTCTELIPW